MLTHVNGSGAPGIPSADGRTVMPISRRTAGPGVQNSCFFRSGPLDGRRKALVKITDRCDLHCAHCFVSATREGSDMPASALSPAVMKRFAEARVANVTLTGGEPFVHPELHIFAAAFVDAGMDVTICTNGVSITDADVRFLRDLERVRVNVSLDGASEQSHGRFRGNRASFEATMRNTRALADAGLLKGILCTPNALGSVDEYEQLYSIARDLEVEYLLMNPLSSFGRGTLSRARLEASAAMMTATRRSIEATAAASPETEAVFVRFPGQTLPLSSCIAGDVIYVFADGKATVCPYLVFAARNPGALHQEGEFIVGNIFDDVDFAERLDAYRFGERYRMGANSTCSGCGLTDSCGKGCPAAVIAAGGRIGDLDVGVCPVGGPGEGTGAPA
jgi:radical SAM protein with 4Fe4S-binding SPASM domain